MDWDKLKVFYAVAQAGSFTNASVSLNLSQSAISRQIQSLEQELKVQLFERHARGLTLTDNGEYIFKTAHEVISKLKEVETTLSDKKQKPTGKITITTVRSFGTHWLTPRIQEFMELNPEIEVELIFDDKELDLSTREADIGIWMRRPKQLNYIQRKLTDINYHVYGSNKYLEKYGYPKTVNDLNLSVNTIIVNGQSYGQEGGIHKDHGSENENSSGGRFTVVLYLNRKWHPTWQGETMLYNNSGTDIVKAVVPNPGRVLLFDARIPHQGRPPHRLIDDLRMTMAFHLSNDLNHS